MTKVIVRYRLQSPLAEPQLARLAEARSVYGILNFDLDTAADRLAVEYDASRLRPEEVAGVLRRAGVPAVPELQ